MMRRLVMASASASTARRQQPVVWLLDLDTGMRVPVPSALDGDGVFDRAEGRAGWVAAHVGDQVGAFADGDLDNPVLLPGALQILPAMAVDLLLLRTFSGGPSRPGEPMRAMVVGPDGRVHCEVELPWSGDACMYGEVASGIVTRSGIGGWDASVTPLPVKPTGDPLTEPRPFAVLAGRTILFEGVDHVHAVDVVGGSTSRIAIAPKARQHPFDQRFWFGTTYSASGEWVAAGDDTGTLIGGVDGQLRWLTGVPSELIDLPVQHRLWLGNRLLLIDPGQHGPTVYDPATDTHEPTLRFVK